MLSLLLVLAIGSTTDGGSISAPYAYRIRVEIATAQEMKIRSSPELGERTFTIRDTATLVDLARRIPNDAQTSVRIGNIASTEYIVARLSLSEADNATEQVTIVPTAIFLDRNDAKLVLRLPDRQLFDACLSHLKMTPTTDQK